MPTFFYHRNIPFMRRLPPDPETLGERFPGRGERRIPVPDKRPHIIQPRFGRLAALDIEVEQLRGVMLDVPHLDGSARGKYQRASLALICPDALALLVVALVPVG